jgi:two-component system, OmpR family, phosphate regulon sensor histidine kinase PhoR
MVIIVIVLSVLSAAIITYSLILQRRLNNIQKELTYLINRIDPVLNNTSQIEPPISHHKRFSDWQKALKIVEGKFEDLTDDTANEKRKMAAIMSITSTGLLFINRDRHVTMLNQSAAKLFNLSCETVIGQPLIILSHDHEIDTMVQKCLESNETQTGKVQLLSGANIELTVTPLGRDVLVRVEDVTNLKRLENIRRDFVANVSHELRTPISSLKALVETLENGAIKDKSVAKDFIHRMHIEADKLAQLVNELNELSRIESGEVAFHLVSLDLAAVIMKAVERLRPPAERAKINIITELSETFPSIEGDENKLEQVFINIIHNAIKFTPQNGQIRITSIIKDAFLLIMVKDTGIGIPADDLPRIFERFYKVDKARSSGGTGLGLAISKHIIKNHHGDIYVESEEGKGTTFTVKFPVAGVLTKI